LPRRGEDRISLRVVRNDAGDRLSSAELRARRACGGRVSSRHSAPMRRLGCAARAMRLSSASAGSTSPSKRRPATEGQTSRPAVEADPRESIATREPSTPTSSAHADSFANETRVARDLQAQGERAARIVKHTSSTSGNERRRFLPARHHLCCVARQRGRGLTTSEAAGVLRSSIGIAGHTQWRRRTIKETGMLATGFTGERTGRSRAYS